MDPQIETVYGRADHAVSGFPDLFERLIARSLRFCDPVDMLSPGTEFAERLLAH